MTNQEARDGAGPLGSGHSPRATGRDVGDCGGSVEEPSTHLIHGPAPTDQEGRELAQLIQNAQDGDLCANGWSRKPGPSQVRAAGAVLAWMEARGYRKHPEPEHDCETCAECLHDGHKCCGCYDGVCCHENRKPLVIGGEFVSVEVSPRVERALRDWERAHLDDLRERLAGTGVTVDELLQPSYRRLVTLPTEVIARIEAALA